MRQRGFHADRPARSMPRRGQAARRNADRRDVRRNALFNSGLRSRTTGRFAAVRRVRRRRRRQLPRSLRSSGSPRLESASPSTLTRHRIRHARASRPRRRARRRCHHRRLHRHEHAPHASPLRWNATMSHDHDALDPGASGERRQCQPPWETSRTTRRTVRSRGPALPAIERNRWRPRAAGLR